MSQEQISIIAKCVGCKKIQELTAEQILEAEETGAAISTCCFMPMVIEKATISKVRKPKKK